MYSIYCVCGECILLTHVSLNQLPRFTHPDSPIYSAYVVNHVHMAATKPLEACSEETPIIAVFYGVLKDRASPIYIRHDHRKYEKMYRYKCAHCELTVAYSQEQLHPKSLYIMTSMAKEKEKKDSDEETRDKAM
jgi:hypothetical protein